MPITGPVAATPFASGPISARIRAGAAAERGYSAGDDHAAAEPASAVPLTSRTPFLVQGEPGGGDGHRRVRQRHRDVKVIGDPLKLGVHNPDQAAGTGGTQR